MQNYTRNQALNSLVRGAELPLASTVVREGQLSPSSSALACKHMMATRILSARLIPKGSGLGRGSPALALGRERHFPAGGIWGPAADVGASSLSLNVKAPPEPWIPLLTGVFASWGLSSLLFSPSSLCLSSLLLSLTPASSEASLKGLVSAGADLHIMPDR